MMMQDYINAKVSIWGDESMWCAICFDGERYTAQCVMTDTLRYINEDNYSDVINEMFFDYCMQNAKYMGVS